MFSIIYRVNETQKLRRKNKIKKKLTEYAKVYLSVISGRRSGRLQEEVQGKRERQLQHNLRMVATVT